MPIDIFYAAEFSIPAVQIVLLLLFSTIVLLFGRTKLALLVNYVFALYWGYFLNRDRIYSEIAQSEIAVYAYFGFGILVVVMAMAGFLQSD